MVDETTGSRGGTTLANWRTAPFSRWGFHHVRELLPTANIAADRAAPEPFSAVPRDLSAIAFQGLDGNETTLGRFLPDSFTDALVILQGNRIVTEWYDPGYGPTFPHIVFSISKSITSCLTGILAGHGLVDPEAPATRYVPEAADSAWGDCTLRHILDMVVAIDFTEPNPDPDSDYMRYRASTGWNPPAPGGESLDQKGFLLTLRRGTGQHGEHFSYISPNTDFLGWILERAAGRPMAELLSEHIWRPMGARDDAYITLDRLGAPRNAGGICTTARDLALFGTMVRDGGRANGRQVVPADWIEDIRANGSHSAWLDGDPLFYDLLPDGRYRSKWYQTGDDRGSICAIGIHGQWIYIDPIADAVIVKLSAQPEPLDDPLDRAHLRGFDAICRALT